MPREEPLPAVWNQGRVERPPAWEWAVFIGLGWLVLVLGVFSYWTVLRRPAYGMRLNAVTNAVVSVDQGGPADMSGVRVGDVLVRLGSVDTIDRQALNRQWAVYRPGNAVLLLVRRETGLKSLILVPHEQNPLLEGYIVFYVVAAVFWVVGLFVYYNQPAEPEARLYLLFSLVVAITLVAFVDVTIAWWLQPVYLLSIGLTSGFFHHFIALIPRPRPFLRRFPWLTYSFYVPGLSLALLTLIFRYLGWPELYSISLNLLWVSVGLTIALAIVELIQDARYPDHGHLAKRQYQVLLVGALVGLLPAATMILVDLISGWLRVDPRLLVLSLALFPVALTYGALRFRLMDITLLASRGLAYAALTVALIGVYFGVAFLLSLLPPILARESGPVRQATVALAIALLFNPLRERAQLAIDRLFYRDRYLYRQAIQRFSRTVTRIIDLPALIESMAQQVAGTIHVDRAAIFLRESDDCYSIGYRLNIPVTVADGCRFRSGDPFVELLYQNGAPLYAVQRPEAFVELPASEQAKLQTLGTVLFSPFLVKGELLGWLSLGAKLSGDLYTSEDLQLLDILDNQAAVAIKNAELFEETVQKSHDLRAALDELEETYNATLEALSAALDARDQETEGHSRRVMAYTLALAEAMGVDEQAHDAIRFGALLHDVGKIGVRDQILLKAGPLEDSDWVEMRDHPIIGYRMLRGIGFLEQAIPIVLCHHERWDGSGYPRGLAREEIPLAARLFAVADTLDAITSHRPYRPAKSFSEAKTEIARGSGSQFDPQVVEAFLCIPEEMWISLRDSVFD